MLDSIETALTQLRRGQMIILVDDPGRENEGDLVVAAQYITPSLVNDMIQKGGGLICLAMKSADCQRLGITPMVANNQSIHQTAFGVSIDASEGITTGISASDRAHTIQIAATPKSTKKSLVMPGHVFPLQAAEGGVLERRGHTEGSVDLLELAGLQPMAAICEILNKSGEMARMPDLIRFAKKHQLPLVSIESLISFHLKSKKK